MSTDKKTELGSESDFSYSSPSSTATPSTASPAPRPASFPYLVPNILPRRSINLLIGPAMSGRTSLLLPQLESYLSSATFLDYSLDPQQQPEQLAALCCSRSFDWLWRKIRSLRLDNLSNPLLFPIETWHSSPGEEWQSTLARTLDHLTVAAQSHRPRLLFVEGFQMLMPGGKINDPSAVNSFLLDLQSFCSEHDIAIIGSVGEAKMKNGDNYPLLQQRVMGSVQWAEPASSLIGIEIMDAKLPATRRSTWREITVMARGEAPRTLYADFDQNGRLVPAERPDEVTESVSEQYLDGMLSLIKPGEQFKREEVLKWGEAKEISRSTCDRWKDRRCKLGMIEKLYTGRNTTYRKPFEN